MTHLRNRYLLLTDAVLLVLSAMLAVALRFESVVVPREMQAVCLAFLGLAVPVKLAVLVRCGIYGRLWGYAGVRDLEILAASVVALAGAGAAVGLIAVPLLLGQGRTPISIIALDALLSAGVVVAARLVTRVLVHRRAFGTRVGEDGRVRRAVVVGAGSAGSLIAREMMENPKLYLRPVAFVDDSPVKQGRKLHGVPVLGTLSDLPAVIDRARADEVVIAMPSAAGAVVRRVVQLAAASGRPTRTVPGLYELIGGHKSVSALRRVEIADLLRREPVCTDLAQVRQLATGKVVLVTGAGGSIGSELCRQIAALAPERLVLVGRGENSVFELMQNLQRDYPELRLEPVIADVRDRGRMERAFATWRPATVFHAAAHKHVPLMEQNIAEAVLNNVLGTRVAAELADAYGAERFVLISSDKAVRPSSVMGATKRLAEGVIQQVGERSRCRFVAVRFGNVLGSRGSVIPTFLRQIRAGGAVTITHPEMRRYFMTIPEAVQLVLQAGVMGEGGEVFVLDMGEAVKVVDLARDLIRLSGLVEGEDVEIRFTGMRPGEKLYEELFFDEESAVPTEHPKVLRARNAALHFPREYSVDELVRQAMRDVPGEVLREGIRRLVPDYTGGLTDGGGAAADERGPATDAPRAARGRGAEQPVASVA